MRSPLLVLPVLALTLAGCSSSSGPDAFSSQRPSPSTSPSPTAAERLTALATAAVGATYSASYALTAEDGSKASVTTDHLPTGYRVDIASGKAVASLIGSSTGTVACQTESGKSTCFSVAGAAQPVPALFDAGVQHVFTDYLGALAKDIGSYEVQATEASPAPPPTPPSTCFSVTPSASASSTAVPAGTYCLTEDGVPTVVTYGKANIVLTALNAPPTDARLTPPASPQPLPSASASPPADPAGGATRRRRSSGTASADRSHR